MAGARERSISVPPPTFFCLTSVQLFVQLYLFYKIRHTKKNKQTNKVLQATSHVCPPPRGPPYHGPTCTTKTSKVWVRTKIFLARNRRSDFDLVAHNCHGETKNLTAKTKTSRRNRKPQRQKQNTSRQNQILHSNNKIALVLPWVFALAVRYLGFAVKYLVLP